MFGYWNKCKNEPRTCNEDNIEAMQANVDCLMDNQRMKIDVTENYAKKSIDKKND
jgi:hypothetical protein